MDHYFLNGLDDNILGLTKIVILSSWESCILKIKIKMYFAISFATKALAGWDLERKRESEQVSEREQEPERDEKLSLCLIM